ncbi:hypothetical protein BYT27DRAFT_6794225 [Phlegmacium glaucopus]|nr:hypothetical protein BYT27DRAFT_6794225 [Phlegmacium glaucopus]
MDPPQLNFTENLTLITETQEAQVPRSESTDEVSTASFYEMMHCNSIHHAPSKSSLSTTSRDHLPLDFGHIGLLTPRDTLETPVTAHSFDDRDNLVSWFPYSPSSDKLEKLHTIGWLEYHFPNGNFYYFHPERKLSTEADLTNDTVFNLVEEFWEQEGVDVGIWSGLRRNSKLGMTSNGFVEDEIWLKDIGSSNEGSNLMFEMWWVDHVARTMVLASSSQEINNDGAAIQEDHIDMEHRYWAFMQSHPAHTVLPPNAKSAAINTLAWAWTDHLLSSHPSDSIPFTRDECRDSLTLLQSLIGQSSLYQVFFLI